MQLFLVIIIVILVVWIGVYVIKHSLKAKQETITAFTGGLGSGKTFLTVKGGVERYRKNLSKYYRKYLLFLFLNLFRKKKNKKRWTHEKPILLSNIPIGIKKAKREKLFKKRKWIYCHELTYKHLLLQEHIPLGSVIILDEIGAFASQYDFNKYNVKVVFDEFVRFFRHYVSNKELKIQAYMFVNDQCSENINLVIRRRLNTIHNLSNFKLWFGHFLFYFDRQMNISEEIKTVDVKQGTNEGDTQDNSNMEFKLILFKPKYDSYCYHDRYNTVPIGELHNFTKFQKDDLLICPNDKLTAMSGRKE